MSKTQHIHSRLTRRPNRINQDIFHIVSEASNIYLQCYSFFWSYGLLHFWSYGVIFFIFLFIWSSVFSLWTQPAVIFLPNFIIEIKQPLIQPSRFVKDVSFSFSRFCTFSEWWINPCLDHMVPRPSLLIARHNGPAMLRMCNM